jgi:hypothetical protein
VHLRRVHYRLLSQEHPVPMVGSDAEEILTANAKGVKS